MFIARSFGIAAPREVHARVVVNGQYKGLYGVEERITKKFVQANFPGQTNQIYKFSGTLTDLDDLGPVTGSISGEEAAQWEMPAGKTIPESLQQKVQRCLYDTVEVLVERGLVTSGETLARVLPTVAAWRRSCAVQKPSPNACAVRG